jgi:hypothetical protein
VFAIEMLPAGHGDSLWIEYGEDPAKPHRILIDGGTGPTYDVLRAKIDALPGDARRFELMAVTHIDADHIEGMVRLLQDDALQMEFGDAWFNGWRHLPTPDFGPEQGEILSALLLDKGIPWNRATGDTAVCRMDGAPLPAFELEGGMRLTVLGPTPTQLADLQVVWKKELEKEGLAPGSTRDAMDLLFKSTRLHIPGVTYEVPAPLDVKALSQPDTDPDTSEPNASSITLLAEYDGKSAILSGDCVAPVLAAGVAQLNQERGQDTMTVDAFKLPHHGSRRNVRADFLPMVKTSRYLFSSNGAYFNHPDREAVARVLLEAPGTDDPRDLLFNYRSEENEVWDDPALMEEWHYRAVYPEPRTFGRRVEL